MKSTTVALGFLTGVSSAAYNHPRHFHNAPRFYRRDNGTAGAYPVAQPPKEEATPSTTLTVAVTNYHTVISCAPTVTNCPANSNNTAAMSSMPASDLVTKVQTSVVDLYTTVCPVTAAESVSKSVVQAHSSGYIVGTTRAPGPVPTPAGPAPTGNAPKPGESVSESVGTTNAVLTMTVGPSGSQSVVTTTIKSTYTAKVTVTKPAAPGAPKETSGNSPAGEGEKPGKQNNGGNYPVAPKPSGPANAATPSGPAGPAGPEGTTTIHSTTTGTRTVTVAKSSTATQNAPAPTGGNGKTPGNQQPGTPGSEGQCNCPAPVAPAAADCPAPVTVTVSAPASTVYVTAPAAAATGATGSDKPAAPGAQQPQQPSTGSNQPGYPAQPQQPSAGSDKPSAGSDKPSAGSDKPSAGSDKPSAGSNQPGYPTQPQQPATGSDKPATGAEGDDDNCEAEEDVTVSQTATVVPYPTGAPNNGTIPMPTGAAVKPSSAAVKPSSAAVKPSSASAKSSSAAPQPTPVALPPRAATPLTLCSKRARVMALQY
ncbi:uncharacterized protein PG986_009591 [Apiospora aurea]|uniref:Uncharacterized protein n=1 Tax=Apiospora aurea TaxID=335848 RepID=A0ABR1Q856_9PEZI